MKEYMYHESLTARRGGEIFDPLHTPFQVAPRDWGTGLDLNIDEDEVSRKEVPVPTEAADPRHRYAIVHIVGAENSNLI
jgi:hypothetical protein